jgi:hypothetical protein
MGFLWTSDDIAGKRCDEEASGKESWPHANEKKEPQIPSASLGAGTSTARLPDPHNHPNEPATAGRSLGIPKEVGRKFFTGAALRRKSFTTETRRARSFSFFRGFSVISVPPWLIFISMGGPQTRAILRMTSLKALKKNQARVTPCLYA